ncbi:PREDICTED: beta-1,3-galactosyltransferase 4 [Chinchilla lanigera]|uniref:beta-1,3-galactosyltransferase 4 n=1 Tax=Chinchilla lanigera TaxID=34839 RepID=UPI000695EDB9|nr:PREDICTED: beta-1,3-galactosyltransferase 4 [Chinchilla lanigera]
MPLSLPRRLLPAALLLAVAWTLFGPSGVGEELLSLSLASLLPAPAKPGPPPALPRLLVPNRAACGGPGGPPFLLILVCTAPENRNRRDAIRATWGGLRRARGLRVRTLFVLGEPRGQPPAGGARADLAREAAAQGDVVQAAFRDTYRNLTLKTLVGLSWASAHCPQARYVLKTDDDVYVNVPELVSELVRRGGAAGGTPVPLLYLGRVHWWVRPSRAPGGRHLVSEEQWPATWGPFPPYASGTGYVLSASAVQLILKVAAQAPALPLEDVFVGVSARRGGLAPTHCVRLAGATHYPLDRCCYGKFLLTSHGLDPGQLREAWELVHGPEPGRTRPFCSWLQGALGILRCRLMAWLRS